MEIKEYHKQNRFQKEVMSLIHIFKPDSHKVNILKQRGIGIYQPPFSKLRLALSGLFIVGCVSTPATNGLIPFAVKWGLK